MMVQRGAKKLAGSFWGRLCVCAVLMVGLAGAAPSHLLAQQPSPDPEDVERAKEHFARGASHFYKEQYDQAVVEFLNAYDYYPDPMILFNLARAHAHLDNTKVAIRTAEKARDSGELPADTAIRNSAHLVAWRSLLEGQRLAETIAGPADESGPPEPGPPEPDPPPADPALRATGWTGVGLSVVGAGLLGWAGYTEFSLQPQIANYRTAADAGDEDAYAQFEQDIRDQQQVGLVTFYSGLACVAAGAGLLTYDLVGRAEQPDHGGRVSVGPAPSGDGASLGLTFEFK